MLFEQFFDPDSSTYTYLVARRRGGEALLIDPVVDRTDEYLRAIEYLDLKLVQAVDTHVHADHVTGLGKLRDLTGCVTAMGAQTQVECVSRTFEDDEVIEVDGLEFEALYTPGHTDDSYSLLMGDRVFTGDTLLIGGTGRTDFQNGDARAQYDSLFNVLLKLPDDTLVFPAHDYRGNRVTTIGTERLTNPRLQVRSADEYAELMANLNLPHPKMMDVAVPANRACGTAKPAPSSPSSASGLHRTSARGVDVKRYRVVDVREPDEWAGELGHIPQAELVPLAGVERAASEWKADQPILLVCRSGRRSARAGEALLKMGFRDVTNLEGGMLAWNRFKRPVEHESAS